MGLGKTIQSAIMLQYLYREQGINGPFLIVAPMSTIEQWKRELELWTDLNVVILHGSADGRDLIFDKEFYFEEFKKR
jgi:SNF2 family DNA or RNA helicase